MRLRATFAGLTLLAIACGGVAGCSDSAPGTDLEAKKPLTQAEQDQLNKQVMEGMKSGYKGAPGVPLKKQ